MLFAFIEGKSWPSVQTVKQTKRSAPQSCGTACAEKSLCKSIPCLSYNQPVEIIIIITIIYLEC